MEDTSQMMNLIGKQNDASGASTAAPSMSDSSTAPMSSPMSTPEPKMGTKEAAMVNLSMAMDLIEQSLPALGSESPEGQKALGVLRVLSGVLGPKKDKTGDLQRSEILQLLQALPQAGGATPESKALAQAPAIPGMSPGGAPSAPPGMPPGGAPQPMPM
jgi:hypothetical protein